MISEERLYSSLGAKIRQLREGGEGRKRMTQAELAQLVGLERTSITNIEKGTQKVPLHILYRICEVFNVDIIAALPKLGDVQESNVWRLIGGTNLPPLAAQAVENLFANEIKEEAHEL